MKKFTLEEYQQFHLNEDRLKRCYDEKWFKLFVPRVYGGLELDMTSACKQLLAIAEIQGGMGWTVNLGAGANWFSGFFEDEIGKALFSSQKAVIAGSGMTNGVWKSSGNGFKISGKWEKCTGAQHATLFSLTAENTTYGQKTFVVPREKVQLSTEKWPIMGMRNSSSFGITLENVEIPKGYDFEMNKIKNHKDYGVFYIPFPSFARLCMTASYLGVVQCLIKYCEQYLQKPSVLAVLKKDLKPMLESARSQLYYWTEKAEEKSKNNTFTKKNTQELQKVLGENNIQIFNSVQSLFLVAGLPFVEEDNLIHWAYRDVLTAVQHFMVKP